MLIFIILRSKLKTYVSSGASFFSFPGHEVKHFQLPDQLATPGNSLNERYFCLATVFCLSARTKPSRTVCGGERVETKRRGIVNGNQ